ncbi:MAG TPA: hypothetical protein VF221_18640 [Chloroflexota bacterium]
MMNESPLRPSGNYRAYLVRLWQESPDIPWRVLARDVETGEECRFATIEQLFLFLHRQTEGATPVIGQWKGETGIAGHSAPDSQPEPNEER